MVNEMQDYENAPIMPTYGVTEAAVNNIVSQIDPQTIIDNLDHALKGEQWNKESNEWVLNPTGKPLVNDECRSAIISYLDGILNNNTTMGNIDEKRLSFLMESVIDTIKRIFVVNLERFGFVPEGEGFKDGIYYNRGTPDSARMTLVANMIFKVCFMVFTRALRGQESIRIFKSLKMVDTLGFGNEQPQQQSGGWVSKLFGRRQWQ